MLEKIQSRLEELEKRYEELERQLSDPGVIKDQDKWRSLTKEHSSMKEIVEIFRRYKKVEGDLQEGRDMLRESEDEEMSRYLKEEISSLNNLHGELWQELKFMLFPRNPHDEKSVIVEIRAGAGGEEAALFAADLLRMYTRYAENRSWRAEIMDSHPTGIGGLKEVIFVIEGQGAFSRLKYESGVHRVQRIPTTESGGRIHTSTATVAVLPEAEEVEVEINPQDLRIDTFCSTGPGGQSVNTTQSAVRVTHLPTEIVVSCQDEKSQLKNREKAMRILRARLFDKLQAEQEAEVAEERRSQVGTGDRSERIRTYNFPQGRVTDHRIGLTLHKLEMILEGNLDEVVDILVAADQARQMQKVEG